MTNKNNVIVSDNPFKNLTRTEIDLYYILLNLQIHYEKESMLEDDGYFIVGNLQLSNSIDKNIYTVSRGIAKLIENDLIKVKYIPSKNGEIRKVHVNS